MYNSKEEILFLARQLRLGSNDDRKNIGRILESLDNDGLIDFIESSREIMYENSGDEQLYHMMYLFIEYIHAEQSNRIIGNFFCKASISLKKVFSIPTKLMIGENKS